MQESRTFVDAPYEGPWKQVYVDSTVINAFTLKFARLTQTLENLKR